MPSDAGKRLALGFIAAAVAVVVAHQVIIFLLTKAGILPAATVAWNMKPYGPFNVPTLVNSMFWGGLWGALFGLIHERLPGGALWLKGLVYGLLIVIVSNWTLLPLIRRALGVTNAAQIAFFSGFDPMRMLAVLLILGGFGIGTGIIYGLLRGARA